MSKSSFKRKNINIIKSTGAAEKFSPIKLHNSLRHCGLPVNKTKSIVQEVTRHVKKGSTTKEIYSKAFKLVRNESSIAAIHYSLKRAILDLGPSGHAFEHLVSKYFEELGYSTQVGVLLGGEFVKHEVDVIAQTSSEKYYVECKFHNQVGKKNDIKIALYVKARWDDLKAGEDGSNLLGFYLASNTAFTKDVLDYAAGTGLRLLGLNAPKDEPFIEKIKRYNLYPVTSLRRLKKYVKAELIKSNIVTCKQLLNEKAFLLELGLDTNDIELLFKEIHLLLEGRQ